LSELQSPSTQQPPLAGTQCRLVQVSCTHSLFAVHAVPSVAAHVLGDAELSHAPDVQTAAASAQIAVCKPSLGMAVPLASFAAQATVDRSQ
jgi:hypothetical protein